MAKENKQDEPRVKETPEARTKSERAFSEWLTENAPAITIEFEGQEDAVPISEQLDLADDSSDDEEEED